MDSPTSDPRLRRGAFLTGSLGVGLFVGFCLHARAWAFLCDDAFISFRYAVNLAHAGALEYNLGERVEGYTNFLWVLILALGEMIGLAPPTLASLLTVVGAGGLIIASVLLLRGLRGRRGQAWSPEDLAPAALMVASPEVMVWSQGGLETSFAAALTFAAMVAWIHRRPRWAALFAGLAGLTRADALIVIAAFGAAWSVFIAIPAWLRGRGRENDPKKAPENGPENGPENAAKSAPESALEGNSTKKPDSASAAGFTLGRLAVAALIFTVLVGGHLVFRRLYYGAWVPNTWVIKSHGSLLRSTHGVPYLDAWITGIGLRELPYLAGLLVFFRSRHLVIAVPMLAAMVYAWSVGGDFMAYSRFLLGATALFAILVAWLLLDLGELLGKRWPRLRPLGWIAVLALAGLQGSRAQERWTVDQAQSEGWLDGRWEGVRAMDHFALERLRAGAWMRENLPADTWITVGAAGALPYASGLPTIDAYGLVDPTIASLPGVEPVTGLRARPGHQIAAPLRYLRERDPDLFCHVGYVGERRPSTVLARRRGLGRNVVWACVEPEPQAHPREPGGLIGVNYYCCLRSTDRVVGPFGADE